MPRISVITPTYNRPEMLPRAIASVLAQTFADFELIIIDDCPEKPAETIVRSFDDPRIMYIKHDKNQGGAAARNTGMKAASGDFFCFIDDDDEWFPDILEVELAAIANTPDDVGFVFAAVLNVLSDGTSFASKVPSGVADYHERALSKFSGFIGQTLMVKRGVYEHVGGWDPTYPSHQETEWILRITRAYKGLGLNRPVVRIFLGNSHARIGNNPVKGIKGRELLFERYKEEFESRPQIYAKHLFRLATWYRTLGNYKQARNLMGRSFLLHPHFRYLMHFLVLSFGGFPYRFFSFLGVVGVGNEKNTKVV